jgi:type I site-specific restriction-modification system R (restriction) subunit
MCFARSLVVLTDRNDLDDQLFGTFSMCKDLLRQTPQQAEDREHLRKLLDRILRTVVNLELSQRIRSQKTLS